MTPIAWVRETFQKHWLTLASIFWLIILVSVGIRVAMNPDSRTTYPIFSASARLFWQGGELYYPHRPETVQGGFRYPPTFIILATPFALLPDAIGGVLWRIANVTGYLLPLVWFGRSVLSKMMSNQQLALLTILTIPLALPSINNGQVNVLVTGMLLATVAAVAEKRWNLACFVIAIAFVCKVYPLALGMILVGLYPRQLLWRLPIYLIASLALPFLLQRPEYVIDQYAKLYECLRLDDRSMFAIDGAYRDLWLLIRIFELPVSFRYYQIGQVFSGAAIAGLCWYRQWRDWPEKELLTSTLALATAWMLLLGPSPESCTFILLAPSIAWAFLNEVEPIRSPIRLSLVLFSSVLFLLAFMSSWVPDVFRMHGKALHSYATLIWTCYLLIERKPSSTRSVMPTIESSLARAA